MFGITDWDIDHTFSMTDVSECTLDIRTKALVTKIERIGIACRYIYRDNLAKPKLMVFHHKDDDRFHDGRISDIPEVSTSSLLYVPLGNIQVYFIPKSKLEPDYIKITYQPTTEYKYWLGSLPVPGEIIMKGTEDNETR